MTTAAVHAALTSKFDAKHVDAALKYYAAITDKFIAEDWDGVALKAGKFVEAITKALVLHCGRLLPSNMRHFKAGNELRALENASGFHDVVRLVVPRACVFIYEIVNNRGGRHDAGEIDANGIDAKVIVPMIQWMLAELVRFSTVAADLETAAELIDGITNRVYPLFEHIDGRTYVNAEKLGAPAVAVLLAYEAYPGRVKRSDLEAAIVRHGFSKPAASMAIHRQKTLFDDQGGDLKLRSPGRAKAEDLLRKVRS